MTIKYQSSREVKFLFVCLFVCFLRSFAQAIACDVTSLKTCVKEKSVEDILAAQLKVFALANYLPFAPVVDGYFMPGI